MDFIRRQAARAVVVAVTVAVAGVVGVEAYRTLEHERLKAAQDAYDLGERTAQRFAAHLAEVFDQASQATLLVNYLRGRVDGNPLEALREAGLIAPDLVQSAYIADGKGLVVRSTGAPAGLNVADEDFFMQHQREPNLGVLIATVREDTITGTLGVPVSRRLGTGGAFEGVVTVTVNPVLLSLPYARLEASGTVVSVLGFDGAFRSRSGGARFSYQARVDANEFAARAALARTEGVPVASPVDRVPRFVSLAEVAKYPLYAVVSMDASAALNGYRAVRSRTLRWAAGALMALAAAAWLLLLLARRLDASLERTRKAEAAFRATLDGSLDAVTILQVRRNAEGLLQDLVVAECNARAAELVKLSRTELLGRSLHDVVPWPAEERFVALVQEALDRQEAVHAELQGVGRALQGRWLHHQVVPVAEGVAVITRDVTEQRAATQRLEHLARVDSLTALANRRGFELFLDTAIARARRGGATIALLYIDLDDFKAVNDRLGHAAGDALLVDVAARLNTIVRAADFVARLGGDEFAVIAESAGSLDDLEELCRRILEGLGRPYDVKGQPVSATPSIGCAVLGEGESGKELCERADAAMYRAKASGKSRFEMDVAARCRHGIAGALASTGRAHRVADDATPGGAG